MQRGPRSTESCRKGSNEGSSSVALLGLASLDLRGSGRLAGDGMPERPRTERRWWNHGRRSRWRRQRGLRRRHSARSRHRRQHLDRRRRQGQPSGWNGSGGAVGSGGAGRWDPPQGTGGTGDGGTGGHDDGGLGASGGAGGAAGATDSGADGGQPSDGRDAGSPSEDARVDGGGPAPCPFDTAEFFLWPATAPGSDGVALTEKIQERSINLSCVTGTITDVTRPSIFPYLAPRPNGAAALIMPGGAYSLLAFDLEGVDIAKWLNSIGVTAFIVKYRLPADRSGRGQAREDEAHHRRFLRLTEITSRPDPSPLARGDRKGSASKSGERASPVVPEPIRDDTDRRQHRDEQVRDLAVLKSNGAGAHHPHDRSGSPPPARVPGRPRRHRSRRQSPSCPRRLRNRSAHGTQVPSAGLKSPTLVIRHRRHVHDIDAHGQYVRIGKLR